MSRLDHSEIKVGTKYEFTTYGCPNVTITRSALGGGGGGGGGGVNVTSGEGVLQSNRRNTIINTATGEANVGGYTAHLEDGTRGFIYKVTVQYPESESSGSNNKPRNYRKTLAENKCFTEIAPSEPPGGWANSFSSGLTSFYPGGGSSSSAPSEPPGGWANSVASFYPGGRSSSSAEEEEEGGSSSSSSAAAPAAQSSEEEEENPKQSSSSAAATPPKAPKEDDDPSRRRRGGRRRRTHRRNMRKRSTRRRR